MNHLLPITKNNRLHSYELGVFRVLAQEAQSFLVFYYFCWNSSVWMLRKVLILLLNSLIPVFTSPSKALVQPPFISCLRQAIYLPKAVSLGRCLPQEADNFYFSQLPSAAPLNHEHPHCQSFMLSPQLLWRRLRAVITHPKPYLLKSKKEAVKKEPNHYKNNVHNTTTTPLFCDWRFYVLLISYQEIFDKAYTSF